MSIGGADERRPLRFITCGSVGVGKSKLVERLFSDQHSIAENSEIGLVAEVLWRSFATKQREFMVTGIPDDKKDTGHLLEGVTKADLAVLVVDASAGFDNQGRYAGVIASMFGVSDVVLVVNKIDLVEFDQNIFEKIVDDFTQFAAGISFANITAIPISARGDDNISTRSERTPWYRGPHLIEYLESVEIKESQSSSGRQQFADQFAAHLVWLSDEKMMPSRSYLMEINGNKVAATITDLKHRLDVDTLSKFAAKTLGFNEIGACNLSLVQPIGFSASVEHRSRGGFSLINRYTNETVAAGIIDFALRRANNIHYQKLTVSKEERRRLMHHKSAVLWFTGLSGAGKSTIANMVELGLHRRNVHTILLDGDNVRHGLNRDLGFTESDRVENIRRIGEVAKLMNEAGLVVLCAFISPFRAERRLVRELVGDDFIEIFVDTPIEQCIARDPKGLYKRALAGDIENFTGINQAYEVPESAELHLMAGRDSVQALTGQVIDELIRREFFLISGPHG
jgi:adenylyl-sulfate kinase